MPQRMAGNGHHFNLLAEYLNLLATRKWTRAACDRLISRCIDLGVPASCQLGDAPLVIGMVMRDEDALERQIFSLQTRDYGCRIARVDDEGTLAPGQQPDVIVLERGNERNFKHAGTIERNAPDVNSRA